MGDDLDRLRVEVCSLRERVDRLEKTSIQFVPVSLPACPDCTAPLHPNPNTTGRPDCPRTYWCPRCQRNYTKGKDV